jgi:LmbE family N-acetylglucosaminyl deacetylase
MNSDAGGVTGAGTASRIVAAAALGLLAAAGCGRQYAAPSPAPAAPTDAAAHRAPTAPQAAVCADPAAAPTLGPPAEPTCANAALTRFDGLLVIGPHPDDEMLGFAGLVAAYRELGKPVAVVVTTDGDAYCEACRFWKTSSVGGATCDALELSNFASPEPDSFAEVRRGESTAAAATLGLPPPTFLGYPDTGLGAAWANLAAGELTKPLRRSDFGKCRDCETCEGGYGEGPATELTAETLLASLRERIAATSDGTLLATTHWLDGHADHAALGGFVRKLNDELASPRAVAYAVIHAHTPKSTPHPDCWYPAPAALACPCMDERCAGADPAWIASLARHRFRPDWPAALPDDAAYGEERQLCLPERLYRGETAAKLAAVRSYASQLGFAARTGSPPQALAGIMDCSGYLMSFVRRTEAFVLAEPAPKRAGVLP